ncbi:hypothetical protein PsYK624_108460 [Phanerochaete sordida]|uniref:Uncharacterized protein n=1 Tax=Phanerochaete sordida TaxID=48140 RepID=A0A9P3LGU6_9APHY|nr:hypothetical protein PsYK624_108460 [Phanerochaete sordida]
MRSSILFSAVLALLATGAAAQGLAESSVGPIEDGTPLFPAKRCTAGGLFPAKRCDVDEELYPAKRCTASYPPSKRCYAEEDGGFPPRSE